MAKMKIKKGDTVVVTSGSEKGKKGEVIAVSAKENKVIVKGVNIRTKHAKARKQGQESGIIKRECPIHASKVAFYCDKCDKGVKLGIKVEEDGKKVRFCKKCQEVK